LLAIPENVAKRLGKPTLGQFLVYLTEELRKIESEVEEVKFGVKELRGLIMALECRIEELRGLMECYKAYYTYMPFDLYCTIRREEIEELHEKYEFVERKIEEKNSMEWLEDAFERYTVVAIFGDGGMGKTRLALEFARRMVEQGLEVYFFNPHAEYKEPSEMRNALVILDDAYEGICERVLNFCLGLSGKTVENVKVLILGRSYFKESIERSIEDGGRYFKVKEKFKSIELKRDDDALRALLKNLGVENKVDEIVERSFGVFYYAIVLAEFYRESGEIDLESALKWKFNTYLRELKGLIREEYDGQILDHLRLLSLIQPLKKGDLNVLIKLNDWDFPINVDVGLLKILKKEGRGLIFEEEGEISIKPDPLADYIRFEWFKEGRDFDRAVFELLRFMPLRVSINVWNIWQIIESKLRVDAKRVVEDCDLWSAYMRWLRMEGYKLRNEHIKLLTEIWKRLNEKVDGDEHFEALCFFTGNLRELISIPKMEYAKVEEWFKHDHEGIQKALVNLLLCYGEILKELDKEELIKGFYKEIKDKVKLCLENLKGEYLASGLTNASIIYAFACDIEKLDECLKRFEEFKDEYRDAYEITLANSVIGYAKIDDKRVDEILEMLRSLNSKHYAGAIYNAINNYEKAKRFKKAERYLKMLEGLNDYWYLEAVFSLVFGYGKEERVEDIRRLIEKVKDIKHEKVAETLVNAIAFEDDLKWVEDHLLRLEKLGYPILTAIGLRNAITRFDELESPINLDRFDRIFEILKGKLEEIKKKDIREAYELAEQIGKASFGAVIFYSKRGELEKAEKYARLVEGVFKPLAIESYWVLYNEALKSGLNRKLFYILKAYKLNKEIIEETEKTLNTTESDELRKELDKVKRLMDFIKVELRDLIIKNLKSPNIDVVRDMIYLTMKILGEEKAKELLLEIASLNDTAWKRVYNFFKTKG
jgi:hypothetical protein